MNTKKTQNIIFNYSKNFQFSTDLKLDGDVIETVSETKLLGTIITNDLNWNKNTQSIVRQSNKRMSFLHKASRFTNNSNDLKKIYMLQVRSKLDQSAVVWHSSITRKNSSDLERVQRSALKVILGEKYQSYKDALRVLKMDSLEMRRQKICLKFAKQCLRHEKLKELFPRNERRHDMEKRDCEKYVVKKAMTERYRKSAIVSMQRLLNQSEREKRVIMKKINDTVPVNNDYV